MRPSDPAAPAAPIAAALAGKFAGEALARDARRSVSGSVAARRRGCRRRSARAARRDVVVLPARPVGVDAAPLNAQGPRRVFRGLDDVGLDDDLRRRLVKPFDHGDHPPEVVPRGLDDHGVRVLVHQDGAADLSVLVLREKLFQAVPELGGVGIIHGDDHGEELLAAHALPGGLQPEIPFHVLRGHDADDVALPGVGQSVGFQDPQKGLVPGFVFDVDGGLPFDAGAQHDVHVGGLGQGPEDDVDVHVVHPERHAPRGKRLFLPGRLVGDQFVLLEGRHVHDPRPPRRRVPLRGIRHGAPFFKEGVLHLREVLRAACQRKTDHRNEKPAHPSVKGSGFQGLSPLE